MARRLAAILAADMVGYSRLMAADEEGTIERQKAHRAQLIDPKIADYGGRIVKTTGDGMLVEFPSVVDAVKCAVDIQRTMCEREAKIPDGKRIRYRVGINLGDIVIDGDDILGDGVNIAARLEGLAEPGGICISDPVYQNLQGKLDLGFVDLGEQALKNMDRRVRAWKSTDAASAPSAEATQASALQALSDKPSIAVLPFTNMSGDRDQDYFADGVTEDIINALALWRSFPVIARNSSFAFKDKPADVRLVASELGARYVLEGSIRRSPETLRVTAQLIDSRSGHHLWAERFDRPIGDVFALQDEITEHIVAAIAPELLRAEEQRASQKRPRDLTAWDLILRAVSAKSVGHGYGTKDGNRVAKEYLDRALTLEGSAEAWAWMALCEWHDAIQGWVEDTEAAMTRCIEAARKSVDQDDSNWLAHSVLGIALLFGRGQAESGVEEAMQSVRLNPSSSAGRHTLGCALDFAGQQEESILHLEAVFRLDPLYRNRAAAYADLALANLLLGDFETALNWARRTVDADPEYVRGRQRLIAALSAAGEMEPARAELERLLELQPGFSLDYVRRTYPLADPAQAARFSDWLRKAGAT